MKEQYQTPPAESLDALNEAANNLHPSHSGLAEILKHVHDYPQEHNPHPMNVVGLKDMATHGGLSKALIFGWRYLSASGSERKFAVEVHHDPDGSNHHFAGLSHGPAVEMLITVTEDDTVRRQIESGAFALSTVSIPALDVFALWLRAASDGDDTIIVVPPGPPFLKPWPAAYTVQQFEDAVRVEAASNVKIDATVFV